MQPLDGITVVALEQAVAAPLATRHLADLGARVIKVERPGLGDFSRHYDRTVKGESSYFVWLNRGKESIELDIKDAADRSVLDAMIEQADVVVQNLIPGAVERLGLDAESLRTRCPRLIHCSISGYGPSGPFRAKKAYDLLVQGEAGLLSVTGIDDSPAKVGVSIADIATGMYAYSGILTALYNRERTGVGQTLHIAMLDAMTEWMMQPIYYEVYGGRAFERRSASHATIAPYGPYRCGDGSMVLLGIQSDREWGILCHEVLARPDLIDDPLFVDNTARVENNALITPLIEAAFAKLPGDEVSSKLEAVQLACSIMRTPTEVFEHPQLAARSRWREVESPGGKVQGLLPPVSVVDCEAMMRAVPSLGAHNEKLRAEFKAKVEHHDSV